MGIGGEYAAINSAIDELIPAKYRGRVDIAVNGTYWGGALIATVLTILVVNNLPVSYSWRVAFLFGPALGFVILFVRKNLPESPRWLLMHGREQEAERRGQEIEQWAERSGGTLGDVDESKAIEITPANDIGFVALARTLFVHYPRRAILGATLMITQSFLYNAIFFTYALVLTKIYNVPATDTAYYFIFFALGNLIGPLTIGHLFDTIGRRKMIAGTYILSGAAAGRQRSSLQCGRAQRGNPDGVLVRDLLLRLGRRVAAYLTVSEIFPVEVRAKAIAVFFAIAQSFGAFGPWLYGELIGNGQDHFRLFIGYLIGAGVMLVGGIVAAFLRCRRRAEVPRGHRPATLGRTAVPTPLGDDRGAPVAGSAAALSPEARRKPLVSGLARRENASMATAARERAKDVIHERPKDEWHNLLDEVTKVRTGDDVTVELLDSEFGDAFEVERLPLAYVEYDEHADEASVAVGGRTAATQLCCVIPLRTPRRSSRTHGRRGCPSSSKSSVQTGPRRS